MNIKGAKLIPFLAALLLLIGVGGTAFAQPPEGTLTVKLPLDGELTLYTVATAEPIAGHEGAFYYKLWGGFEGCGVNISYLTAENLPEHLAVYAQEHDIAGEKCAVSGGEAVFNSLSPALYLVVYSGEGTVSPFLVSVPAIVNGEMVYDITAEPKYKEPPQTPDEPDEPSTTLLRVRKVWDTEDESIPDSVTAELVRDGRVVATAVLSEENNWAHTWYGLDDGYSYTAVEKDVPEGYLASYKTEGKTVTITNTENTVIVPVPDPDPTEPNPEPEPVEPAEPIEPTEPPAPEPEPEGPKLPQTGEIRWHRTVPMILGAVFCISGTALLRKGKGDA